MRDYFEPRDLSKYYVPCCENCLYFYCTSEKNEGYPEFPCCACCRDDDRPCYGLPISED